VGQIEKTNSAPSDQHISISVSKYILLSIWEQSVLNNIWPELINYNLEFLKTLILLQSENNSKIHKLYICQILF